MARFAFMKIKFPGKREGGYVKAIKVTQRMDVP